MATSDIRAGRAFVEMFVNDSALVKGLNAASQKLKAFGNAVKAIGLGLTAAGGALVTPILLSAKKFAETGDALDKMSKRTGISVEKLSELSFVAEKSGASFDDVERAIRKMQETVVKASEGSSDAALAIQSLGLNAVELRNLKPDEQFQKIAEKVASIEDPALRAADAMKIFGIHGQGTFILPVIENMATASARARELGAVMSKEDVKAAVALQNAYRDLKAALQGVANAVGSAVAPVLTRVLNIISRNVATVSAWIRQNKVAVIAVLGIGAALTAAGLFALGFAYSLQFLGATMAAVSTIITIGSTVASAAWAGLTAVVTGGITLMASAFGVLLGIVEIIALPLEAIPAAIGAAVLAIGAAMVSLTGTFKRMWSSAVDSFNGLKDAAIDTLSAIKAAIEAGDIQLAFKIILAQIKVSWIEVFDFLSERLNEFINKATKGFSIATGILSGDSTGVLTAIAAAFAPSTVDSSASKELDDAKADLANLKTQARAEAAKAASGQSGSTPNVDGLGEAIKAHSAGLFNVGNAGTAFELGAGSGTWQKDIKETADGMKQLVAITKKQLGGGGVTLV